MLDLAAYGWAFAAILAAGFVFWLASVVRNDVSIVDTLWALMFYLIASFFCIGILFGNFNAMLF